MDEAGEKQGPSAEKQTVTGVVEEVLPNSLFRVRMPIAEGAQEGELLLAYLAGKMRLHYIKVMIGDRVTMELSDDGTKGRIIYRK